MARKSVAGAVSKTSSMAPSASSQVNGSDRSSLLKSSFAPSSLQLHLFASVIQSFESQQLRIHDIDTGRLRQQHATRPGTTITSLDWGYYGPSYRESRLGGNKKKRKRTHGSTEDVVVAYGTSAAEICMYSPAEDRMIGTLSGVHERGIRDFKFEADNHLQAWSVDEDGKLVQWDLSKDQAVRVVPLSDPAVGVLARPPKTEPQILCASTTPLSIYTSQDFRIDSFDSFKGSVHTLQRSGVHDVDSSELFLAADDGRFINIYNVTEKKLMRTLVTASEVESTDLFSSAESRNQLHDQLLAVVTRDGVVELFPRPFKSPVMVNGDLKSQRKSMTKKANAFVKLVEAGKKHARVLAASIQGPELVLVSVDGGVDPTFSRIRWQDEGSGELLFEGIKEVAKVRSTSTINSAQMNGVKDTSKTHIDESRAVVTNGDGNVGSQEGVIEISSEEDEDDVQGEDGDEEAEIQEAEQADMSVDEDVDEVDESDAEMQDAAALAIVRTEDEPQDVEPEEPSFGDLLASKHPNTIAIADTFAPERSTYDVGKQLSLPSGMSLGTVLTQALRTNDKNLLETCLHANDAGIIQNTIQRLDSGLAANLLSRLAERLASRPGRYGHLLSWVQWTCVAHGGVLAAQPDVTARIRTLYRVLNQRSKSLDKLLLLKGKLDMLDAQLTLRKQMQAQRDVSNGNRDEPGMIYIEGQADNWSSDEDHDEAIGASHKKKSKGPTRRALDDVMGIADSEDEDEEMPLVNGTASTDGEDDEDESDEEAEVTGRGRGGLYDIEAEVSGDGELDSEDAEDADTDDSEEELDDEDEYDSSMDGFINDGEVSVASDDDDDIDINEEPGKTRKPEKKRSKHR